MLNLTFIVLGLASTVIIKELTYNTDTNKRQSCAIEPTTYWLSSSQHLSVQIRYNLRVRHYSINLFWKITTSNNRFTYILLNSIQICKKSKFNVTIMISLLIVSFINYEKMFGAISYIICRPSKVTLVNVKLNYDIILIFENFDKTHVISIY